jgi:hypothetical protein
MSHEGNDAYEEHKKEMLAEMLSEKISKEAERIRDLMKTYLDNETRSLHVEMFRKAWDKKNNQENK